MADDGAGWKSSVAARLNCGHRSYEAPPGSGLPLGRGIAVSDERGMRCDDLPLCAVVVRPGPRVAHPRGQTLTTPSLSTSLPRDDLERLSWVAGAGAGRQVIGRRSQGGTGWTRAGPCRRGYGSSPYLDTWSCRSWAYMCRWALAWKAPWVGRPPAASRLQVVQQGSGCSCSRCATADAIDDLPVVTEPLREETDVLRTMADLRTGIDSDDARRTVREELQLLGEDDVKAAREGDALVLAVSMPATCVVAVREDGRQPLLFKGYRGDRVRSGCTSDLYSNTRATN